MFKTLEMPLNIMPNHIQLITLRFKLENEQYTFVIRGKVLDEIDISQPIYRRKDPKHKVTNTLSLEEADFSWVMFDLDKINLQKLGFNEPLHQLNPQAILNTIQILLFSQ